MSTKRMLLGATAGLGLVVGLASAVAAQDTTLTIATVNNGDMIEGI